MWMGSTPDSHYITFGAPASGGRTNGIRFTVLSCWRPLVAGSFIAGTKVTQLLVSWF